MRDFFFDTRSIHMSSVLAKPLPVSNPDRWLDDAILIGGASAAMLLAEHMALWDEPQRLPPPAGYIIGTLTWWGIGMGMWAARNREQRAATAWLAGGVVVVVSGGAVCTAHYLRHVVEQLRAAGQRGGQLNGRIVTIRRQEATDGRDDATTAGHGRRRDAGGYR